MSIFSNLLKPKHDWRYGYCPLVCRFCGVERTKANDREVCPTRERGAK